MTTLMQRTSYVVDEISEGARLDRFLSERQPTVSRASIQRAIREGLTTIDGVICSRPSRQLRPGEKVTLRYAQPAALVPHPMDIQILHEDTDIVVVDKPPGLVVHPGAGTVEPTLVEGLLMNRPLAPSIDARRPGVVHRLDKDTSGVLVLAKSVSALNDLQRQFAERSVAKLYLAVVSGIIDEDEALIDAPIRRDPHRPRRMTVSTAGRPAQTVIRVLQRGERSSLILVRPITGRTHQVRVHLKYIGHVVEGDAIYGQSGSRLMLHAWKLRLQHPSTGAECHFEATVPEEFPDHPYASAAGLEAH